MSDLLEGFELKVARFEMGFQIKKKERKKERTLRQFWDSPEVEVTSIDFYADMNIHSNFDAEMDRLS